MRRVLILHSGALGDCALALHLVTSLRRQSPDVAVAVAARCSLVQWAKRHGIVTEATSLDALGVHRLLAGGAESGRPILENFAPFAQIISFLGEAREASSARLATHLGDRFIAIDPKSSTDPAPPARHIVEQWAERLGQHGVATCFDPVPPAALCRGRRSDLRAGLAIRLGVGREPIVLIHPGSGGLKKCVTLDVLERLAERITGRGMTAAWMIGPDEVERFGPAYGKHLERTAPVIFEESVADAADLACGADVFVGHDAGMTHVTALAGVPTVAIFGPTDPRVWRPLGPAIEVVGLPSPDHPPEAWIAGILAFLG